MTLDGRLAALKILFEDYGHMAYSIVCHRSLRRYWYELLSCVISVSRQTNQQTKKHLGAGRSFLYAPKRKPN